MNLRQVAVAALKANPGVADRIRAAAPTGQYKAVGRVLASIVANRCDIALNKATWALVNATIEPEGEEEVNEDF